MNMIDWAKHEVELACKKENSVREEDEWDYGCACYESALRAFEILCNEGHSGFSWSVTKNILIRLMNNLPLTPIIDEDFEDGMRDKHYKNKITIQCPRKSSLFKEIYSDGKVIYTDVERVCCECIDNSSSFYSNQVIRIIDEMFPITMPYYPTVKPYRVMTQDFLVDESMGDFDTRAVFYVVTPGNEKIEINRYFKEDKNGWIEISKNEYQERYDNRIQNS